MRPIPFVPKDLDEPHELVEAIKSRRGGELLALDRMLLHSPGYAQGWNTFLAKVRNELTVPQKLAELAICYVAVLNGANYELEQHAPLFLAAGGSLQQLDALGPRPAVGSQYESRQESLFEAGEHAVLALTFDMTRNITVAAQTMAEIKAVLDSEQQVVEIIGVIAAYNMVSRFLVALQVETE